MKTTEAIQRLRQVIRRQHKALSTESCYVHWLSRYIRAVRQMPKTFSSNQKLEHFLTQLASRRDIAASTQNQALNAILYFYNELLGLPVHKVDAMRAKRPAQMRHAPTTSETQALIERLAVDYVDSYRTRFAFPFMSLDYPRRIIPPATALSFATRSGH